MGLNLDRADFYAKEIDFLISTSYGPGRYDRRYEEQGLDYPVAYVRWTENRNMAEYLRTLADGRVRVGPLVSARHPVDDAAAAYASLSAPGSKPMLVLLTYPESDAPPVAHAPPGARPPSRRRGASASPCWARAASPARCTCPTCRASATASPCRRW